MPAGPAHRSPRCWRRRGLLKEAIEVVFYGIDRGTVTIRDNSGIVSGGRTGTVEPDAGGGLDLTITEQFARSMSLDDALDPRQPALLRDERRAAAAASTASRCA